MAENEELDVLKNARWKPFISSIRGQTSLDDELVLHEFQRRIARSLRRACKLLPVNRLIQAYIAGASADADEIRRQHRSVRNRAETFADMIQRVCRSGMGYVDAVDAFVHGCCAQVLDQMLPVVVPCHNFPTFDDFRRASSIWLFRMEPRIQLIVRQIIVDPANIRAEGENARRKDEKFEQILGSSLLKPSREES